MVASNTQLHTFYTHNVKQESDGTQQKSSKVCYSSKPGLLMAVSVCKRRTHNAERNILVTCECRYTASRFMRHVSLQCSVTRFGGQKQATFTARLELPDCTARQSQLSIYSYHRHSMVTLQVHWSMQCDLSRTQVVLLPPDLLAIAQTSTGINHT